MYCILYVLPYIHICSVEVDVLYFPIFRCDVDGVLCSVFYTAYIQI